MGGFGSQYFSEQIDADKVVAMFNIEIEKAISEVETAQKEIKTIREKYLGKAVI